MLYYDKKNKLNSQYLRKNLTATESLLWSRLRRKQLCGVQFYRQKPILNYVLDFYAPVVKLVIEIDGGQHYEQSMIARDAVRDDNLFKLGLTVLRFSNLEVLNSIDDVVSVIFNKVSGYKNPP